MRLQSTHPPAITSVIQPYLGVPTQIDLVVACSRLPTPTVNHDRIWSNAINVVVDSCSQLLIRSVHCFLHTGPWLQSFHSNGAPAEAERPGRDGCLHRPGAVMFLPPSYEVSSFSQAISLCCDFFVLWFLWGGWEWLGVWWSSKCFGVGVTVGRNSVETHWLSLRRRGRIIGSCGHRSIL